nr:hypothetical protein [uncultured Cohaesibacter sp.]
MNNTIIFLAAEYLSRKFIETEPKGPYSTSQTAIDTKVLIHQHFKQTNPFSAVHSRARSVLKTSQQPPNLFQFHHLLQSQKTVAKSGQNNSRNEIIITHFPTTRTLCTSLICRKIFPRSCLNMRKNNNRHCPNGWILEEGSKSVSGQSEVKRPAT